MLQCAPPALLKITGMQCVAVCCSVVQCATVCFSVLQCVAVCCSVVHCGALWCTVMLPLYTSIAVRVLQRGVVCCSVLQRFAVSYIMLQCDPTALMKIKGHARHLSEYTLDTCVRIFLCVYTYEGACVSIYLCKFTLNTFGLVFLCVYTYEVA